MNIKYKITAFLILMITFVFAQERTKDTIDDQTVNVIKPYSPTISDAFKIKDKPSIEDANTINKKEVKYNIFSIPVASTFTPSKGKAQNVERAPKERVFQNYVSAGFGNFKSPLFEAYIHTGDIRYNDYGVFINHHSSEGGIKNALLNDNFSDTRVDVFYKQFDKDFNWQINGGVQREQYNYYGLPNEIIFEDAVISSIDEKQYYNKLYVGGKIDFEDSIFKGATAELVNLTDNFNSNELRLLVKPSIEFPISSEIIGAEFLVDVVAGKFQQEYLSANSINHSFINLGAMPNFEVLRENLTINLGAKIYYSNDLERKINKFYAYPNISAS